MRWEPRRKRCGLDYKPLENPHRLSVGLSNQPALRFRYTEENVTREPARTTMYANGTTSPNQSISNMTVSWLVSRICFSFDRYGGEYSKLWWMELSRRLDLWTQNYNYLQVMIVSGIQERKVLSIYLRLRWLEWLVCQHPLSLPFPAPPVQVQVQAGGNTTTDYRLARQT
jgi:hypothetical protein